MIRALVFDFDGLIIDSETPDYVTWRQIYQEHGTDLPLAFWSGMIGRAIKHVFDPLTHLEGLIGRSVDREVVFRRKRSLEDALLLKQPILPGVETMIDCAKRAGLKLAVASSADFQWVSGHLTRLGLIHHFDAIRTVDDVAHAKPEPDLYHAVLSALDVTAPEVVAFEDSPNGVTAANRAGIFVVAVPGPLTAPLPLDHADLVVKSLAELPLDRLLEHVEAIRHRAT